MLEETTNSLTIREYSFNWGTQTYVMGVLNVTPDSFSDGGDFNTLKAALSQAQRLVEAGADIIDVGGQSTRPGAEQISLEEELRRVLPVIRSLRRELTVPISIDTTRVQVAQMAVEVGADLVNDISGGTFEPSMLKAVAKLGIPIILMHIRGTPQTMQNLTNYEDLVGEIYQFLAQGIAKAVEAGIDRTKIIIDPGIGFGKTYQQNLELLRKLKEFRSLGVPILVGPSRKSFIGKITGHSDPKQRIWGTAAACCSAIAQEVDILRVHDVGPMVDVCRVADAIWRTSTKLS